MSLDIGCAAGGDYESPRLSQSAWMELSTQFRRRLPAPESPWQDQVNYTAKINTIAALPHANTVFGARHHRWQLAPPLGELEVLAFEKAHRGVLPASYRRWLMETGASGAGPGNGFFGPGTWSTGGEPEPSKKRYGSLRTPFPYSEAATGHRGKLQGVLPLVDLGCGTLALLVTAGPLAGKIWVDDRLNQGGLRPEDGLDFDGWVQAWLRASEKQAREPWRPAKAHPNEPDTHQLAAELLNDQEGEIAAWVVEIEAALKTKGKASLGKRIGAFAIYGERSVFERGTALYATLEKGVPLPDVGVATKLFDAIIAGPSWHCIEVPGLMRAWMRETKRGQLEDYLGRPSYFGRDSRMLVLQVLIASPMTPALAT